MTLLTLKNHRCMKAIGLFFLFTALLMSCSKEKEPLEPYIEMDRESFEKELAAWNLQGLKNYRFSYAYLDALPYLGPVEIAIEEGSEPIIVENPYEYVENIRFKSIDDIYGALNYLLDEMEKLKTEANRPDRFEVKATAMQIEYEPTFHYPKHILYYVRYVEKDIAGTADETFFQIVITEFHIN